MTSPKSRIFERPVLLLKRSLVVWASMASHRPKLSLGIRCNCVRYGFFTGRRPRNRAERLLFGFLSGRTNPFLPVRWRAGERLFRNMSRPSLPACSLIGTIHRRSLLKSCFRSGCHPGPDVRIRADNSGRTFSWDGGSRRCPGVCEEIQRIMKQWVGNAHGDQRVRF